MNERIKQLILAAGFPKFDKMYVVSDGEELEKFAELIIKECAEVAEDYDGAHYVGTAIKQHFGVKE